MMRLLAGASCVLFVAGCAMMDAAPGATAAVQAKSAPELRGQIKFTQVGPDRVRITGLLVGHHPGAKGFHIHETGDCSAPDAMSAGGHFNPAKAKHGASPAAGHAGDLGNITFNEFGRVELDVVIEGLSLTRGAPNGIIGRAIVIHMQADDLKSDPTGNAGGRAGCGVIVQS